jgi:hypothetical protein
VPSDAAPERKAGAADSQRRGGSSPEYVEDPCPRSDLIGQPHATAEAALEMLTCRRSGDSPQRSRDAMARWTRATSETTSVFVLSTTLALPRAERSGATAAWISPAREKEMR